MSTLMLNLYHHIEGAAILQKLMTKERNHYYLDLISFKEMIEFVRVNRSQIGESYKCQ